MFGSGSHLITRFASVLEEFELSNHALVQTNALHINHKTVQKARLGKRPLSPKMQLQLVQALNTCTQPPIPWKKSDFFDEKGNAILIP